jgi:hypothetical protein
MIEPAFVRRGRDVLILILILLMIFFLILIFILIALYLRGADGRRTLSFRNNVTKIKPWEKSKSILSRVLRSRSPRMMA